MKCELIFMDSSYYCNLHSKRLPTPHSAPNMSQSSAVSKPQVARSLPTPPYPTGFAFGMTLFALFISLFCVALDSTIIATAIPRITDQFRALQDVGWYGSSYLLTKCGMYPSVGFFEAYLTNESISTAFWETIPFLQPQMDIPCCLVHL